MRTYPLRAALSAAFLTTIGAAQAIAQDTGDLVGEPINGKMGFQPAATELARDLHGLDHMLTIITAVIVAFVTLLILWVVVRYNARANKTPAKFTHNTPIEVAWTLLPILILVVIGAYSLPVLFKQQEIPDGDIYIKVTGYQWYWGYEYPDEGIAFDSYMIGQPATGGEYRRTPEVEQMLVDAGYTPDQFLLATDTQVVVPVGKTIVMGVTGADVIHSWTIPAFGVKQDAVPGRVAELWFKAERTGTFFGQCSELCGKDHAYMPITVRVVTEEEYETWLEGAREEYASAETAPRTVRLASAD
ncbi:cytochrome c oxidase subunit II [Celeribacter indicus]|uniref:Cytochrome c oxidase subunit 2 n=1 Tax=Celeribacter indicus TaxID=1208324 RepID=A0A0B5DSC0_9RHOB|nr:cytochrome c oxidase subunit II [Celeribacter indicus]AJE45944.1 cytochrome c oxidase subunit II [Celeribacter indicus]SDW64351.1 cytochrome c oxidase subunit 2 [Celeribacter indicus]